MRFGAWGQGMAIRGVPLQRRYRGCSDIQGLGVQGLAFRGLASGLGVGMGSWLEPHPESWLKLTVFRFG